MIFCSSCTTGNCIRASCISSSRGIVIAAAGRLVLSPLACVALATSIGSGEGSRGLKLAFTFSSIWAEVARDATEGRDSESLSAVRKSTPFVFRSVTSGCPIILCPNAIVTACLVIVIRLGKRRFPSAKAQSRLLWRRRNRCRFCGLLRRIIFVFVAGRILRCFRSLFEEHIIVIANPGSLLLQRPREPFPLCLACATQFLRALQQTCVYFVGRELLQQFQVLLFLQFAVDILVQPLALLARNLRLRLLVS
ncbi:hypothetical protein KC356_g256 [Hortaea werneckii]|nr:hypothetical protein KC356_g256 [Hortaea werneckii]